MPNFVNNRLRVPPFLAKLYQKLAILAILGSVRAHFKSHNGEIWQEGADLGLSLQAKFGKKKSRKGYTPFWQNIPKISNFGYFDA